MEVIKNNYIFDYPTLETRHISNEMTDKDKRYEQIKSILKGHKMTAKQIAVKMYELGYTSSPERNNSAPRLTELMGTGDVEVYGTTKCEYTGRPVSVFILKEDNNSYSDLVTKYENLRSMFASAESTIRNKNKEIANLKIQLDKEKYRKRERTRAN